MFCKDTPNFNDELIRWLIAYFLSGNKKTETIYEQLIDLVKISPAEFRDIINEMIINGYVIKEKIYAPKSGCKNILEATHLHYLTQKGKEQLCSGWELVVSAVPKKLYDEALENIRLMNLSIVPPFM